MRGSLLATLACAAACDSGPSEGALLAYRAGIVEAIHPTRGVGRELGGVPEVAEVEASVAANEIRIKVVGADPGYTCGNVYSRVGLAKLKTPSQVTVTCGAAGTKPVWRLRERDGELWSVDLLK